MPDPFSLGKESKKAAMRLGSAGSGPTQKPIIDCRISYADPSRHLRSRHVVKPNKLPEALHKRIDFLELIL